MNPRHASFVSGTFRSPSDRDAALAQLDAFLRDTLARVPGVLACYHVQSGDLDVTNVTVYSSEAEARAGAEAVGPKVAAILAGRLAGAPRAWSGPVVASLEPARGRDEGPFLWVSPGAPRRGYAHVPPGGMCLSAFLFVERGDGRILLGRYDPAHSDEWEAMTGVDPERLARHAAGWTLPASHLRHGEDPREAARRIAREVLRADVRDVGEPRVTTFAYELPRLPGQQHHDVAFLFRVRHDAGVATPPWYAELAWHDPRALPASAYARGHEDVVQRWLAMAPRPA